MNMANFYNSLPRREKAEFEDVFSSWKDRCPDEATSRSGSQAATSVMNDGSLQSDSVYKASDATPERAGTEASAVLSRASLASFDSRYPEVEVQRKDSVTSQSVPFAFNGLLVHDELVTARDIEHFKDKFPDIETSADKGPASLMHGNRYSGRQSVPNAAQGQYADIQDTLHVIGKTSLKDAGIEDLPRRSSISGVTECSILHRPPSWFNGGQLDSERTASTVLGPENATENVDSSAVFFSDTGNEAGRQQPFLARLDAPFTDSLWFPMNDRSEGSQFTISPSGIYSNAGSFSPRNSVVSSSPAHYDPVPIPAAYLDQNYYDGNPVSAHAHSASLESSTSNYDAVPIPQAYLDVTAYGEPVTPARPAFKGIFGRLRSAPRHLPKLKQWKPSRPLRPRNLDFWGAKRRAALKAAEGNGYIV